MHLSIHTAESITTVVSSSRDLTATAPLWAFQLIGSTGQPTWIAGTWEAASTLNALTGQWERTAVSPLIDADADLTRGEIYNVLLRPYPADEGGGAVIDDIGTIDPA
jgi:hypothetical protein